jgi:hypothetical protein
MAMTDCPIRRSQDGHRCARCGARWDADDEAPPCPRVQQVASPSLVPDEFVSALAPDRFI